MNRELKMLLIELLKREDEITDDEFFLRCGIPFVNKNAGRNS